MAAQRAQQINPAFFPMAPDLEWDSRVTIGALDVLGTPFPSNELNEIGIDWTNFEAGGNLSIGNGTWFVLLADDRGSLDHSSTISARNETAYWWLG